MPAEHPLGTARMLRAVLVLVVALALAAPATVLLGQRPASAATAGQVLAEAARHAGKPYQYGATGPGSFDCSGYTGYVFAQVGVSLPRTSGAQRAALPVIPREHKQPGDLIFTHDSGGRVYHVGIYAGNDMIWHSPSSGDVVKHSRIFSPNYSVGRPPLAPPPPPAPPSEIDRHWRENLEVQSRLGNARGPEFPVHGGVVKLYEGGQIVWSSPTGAKAVYGEILRRYAGLGWEQGRLGFAVTDERPAGHGRENVFQHGRIVWTGETGAQVVLGDIRNAYDAKGGPGGELGVPVTEEVTVDGGVQQTFAGGVMYWHSATRATTALSGEVLEAYQAAGGPNGDLGLPVALEPGGERVAFEHGAITYDSSRGIAQVVG